MSTLDSEIDSLLESDEVSQISGLRSKKHEKPLSRRSSSTRMEPDIERRRRKYEERDRRKSRKHRKSRRSSYSHESTHSYTSEDDSSHAEVSTGSYSENTWERSVDDSTTEQPVVGSDSSSETRRKKKSSKRPHPELKPKHKKSITTKLKETVRRKRTKSKSPSKKTEYEVPLPHTREEVMKLTEGFIAVPREKWDTIEAGCEIKWMNKSTKRVSDRDKPAYYWYHKEDKNGKMFFLCGPTASCDLKTPWIKHRTFPLYWDKIKKLFVREDPFTYGLRMAIDNRTVQLSDIAHFLKMKFGDEFDQFMKNRALERKALAEQSKK
jgi:hypothetical protein